MVEWKKLEEVCTSNRGVRVIKKDLSQIGEFPVIQNSLIPMGYYHKSNYNNTPFVITAGAAGEVGFADAPFWAADDCLCLLCNSEVIPKYVYIWLQEKQFRLKSQVRKGAIPRLSRTVVERLNIPIPPLSEQNRIVGILDTFSESIENLKNQIAQRRKQYEHYRNSIFKYTDSKDIIWKKLSEVASLFKGPYITKKDSEEGDYPVIMGGQKVAYYIDKYNSEGDSIVISRSGINAGFVSFWNQPIFVSDGYRIDNKKMIIKKYLFYFLKKNETKINASKKGAGVPHIQSSYLLNFLVPILSFEEQFHIVSILDSFEASISNLEAQLSLRQKQYEYYRNKLLTFE